MSGVETETMLNLIPGGRAPDGDSGMRFHIFLNPIATADVSCRGLSNETETAPNSALRSFICKPSNGDGFVFDVHSYLFRVTTVTS